MNSLTRCLAKNSLVLIVMITMGLSCQRPNTTVDSVVMSTNKVHQGINGKILFKEGEFSPSGEIYNGRVYGIERQIFVYELTNIRDVEIGEGDFIKYNSTEVLDSVTSDKQGNFSKELPAGKYSLFVKESNRLYSKLSEDDYYMPVTIIKDSAVNIVVEVDYKASYLSEQ